MKGSKMQGYLLLEKWMMKFDEMGDLRAENIRDAMDALWYALSDEEHAALDSRSETTKPMRKGKQDASNK